MLPKAKLMPECVLFDLDGTLLDTAQDLGSAANLLREQEALAPLPLLDYRDAASHGAPGLLKTAFGIQPTHPSFPILRARFLTIYEASLVNKTLPFPGILELLSDLDSQELKWGIVTNKSRKYAEFLVQHFKWETRLSCLVCGDDVSQLKPHPDSLMRACELINLTPEACVYIGDAEKDAIAAQRLSMPFVTALYGYVGDKEKARLWPANYVIETPAELLPKLELHSFKEIS